MYEVKGSFAFPNFNRSINLKLKNARVNNARLSVCIPGALLGGQWPQTRASLRPN